METAEITEELLLKQGWTPNGNYGDAKRFAKGKERLLFNKKTGYTFRYNFDGGDKKT